MNDLRLFSSTEFGELSVLMIDGKEWFPAHQCAKILGYSNPRDAVRRHCKAEGVVKRDGVSDTTNQHGVTTQQTAEIKYINEGNLYRLIVSSKLPAAEKFEKWVFDEVLPSIRRNGGYGSTDIEMIAAKAATAAVSEVIKQLMPVLTAIGSASCKNGNKNVAKRYCGEKQPSKMEMLPPDIKECADDMLRSGKYSCQQVANYVINSTGQYISHTAVNRYKNNNFVMEE